MLGLVRAPETLFVRCCAGKASDQRNTFSQAGYLAAAAATNALLKLNPSTIDRGATTHAFRNIKTFRTDIPSSAWYLARAINRNAIHSSSVAEIVNGSLVTRRSCFEAIDPDLAPF